MRDPAGSTAAKGAEKAEEALGIRPMEIDKPAHGSVHRDEPTRGTAAAGGESGLCPHSVPANPDC